jgi:23S rRNA pseudouridine1911/1915/1917 synthase
MEIIFCDNHLLVVVKPAGLSTQPHPGSDTSLQELAKAWLKKEFKKPGNVFCEPVHRLDKPVSGLVLFARTSKALSRMQEMMRQQQIEKVYFAWVQGVLSQNEAELEHFLLHEEHRARVVNPSHPHAKCARLRYVLIDQKSEKSLVKIQLETGRYHQIRAQFAAIGCPVLGDLKYGSSSSMKNDRIALHSGGLKFPHPVTKVLLNFENFPQEMMQVANTNPRK